MTEWRTPGFVIPDEDDLREIENHVALKFDPRQHRDHHGRWDDDNGWGIDTSAWVGKISASVKGYGPATRWAHSMKKKHANDPSCLRFMQMAEDWQDYDKMDAMRTAVERTLAGENTIDGQLWLNVLMNAEPTKKIIFRGFRVHDPKDTTWTNPKYGDEFDLPLSSFSEDDEVAFDYADALKESGGKPVVLRLEPGAQAVAISNFTDDEWGHDIREVVTGGRFVIGTSHEYNGTTFINIKQKGVFQQ